MSWPRTGRRKRSVPPALIWRRTLEEAGALCERALSFQAQWHCGGAFL